MPLSLRDQYDAAISSLTTGDLNALAKVLTDPDSITLEENRTVAEKLGLKGGFLAAAVNTAADPLVWVAAFLSRKFPTRAWIQGTVPKRFVGTANEFSGVSLGVRTTESMFRGTLIPKLSSLSMHRQAEVLKAAEPMWKIMERPNWQREMPVVSQLMEGVNPAGATPELRQVAKDLRTVMDDIWHRFLRQTHKIEGGLDTGSMPRSRPFSRAEAPPYLRDYLPHIPLTGNESTFEVDGLAALDRMGGRRNRAMAQALRVKGHKPGAAWSVSDQRTLHSRYADWQRWIQDVGASYYNPHLFKRQRFGLSLHGPQGQDLFYTDLNLVLQKYVASAAKTYSINAPLSAHERAIASHWDEFGRQIMPTSEPIMVQVIREGVKASGAKVTTRLIPDVKGRPPIPVEQILPETGSPALMRALQTHVRSLRGSMAEDQILFGGLFNNAFAAIDRAKAKLSRADQVRLTDAVSTIGTQRDYRKRLDAITNYFYATTLGLNLKSALNNMTQTITTTMPVLGVGDTIAGIREVSTRVRRFMSGVAGEMRHLPSNQKGLPRLQEAARRSFQQNFPELVDQQLDIDPRLFDISPEQLQRVVSADGKFVDKKSLMGFLLGPFTGAEISNRAIAFYGARHKINHLIRTGEYPLPRLPDGRAIPAAELDALINFEAGNIVSATQFRPGPGSRTVLQSMLPGPLRQFTGYPVRWANFVADSTVRGAMTEKQLEEMGALSRILSLNGRNLGTMARMALFGKIASNGLRDVLGVDINAAMGLEVPYTPAPQDSPFGVFPTPPAVGILTGVVSATATRDIEKLQPMELPDGTKLPIPRTLFPAGIQLNRVFRTMNQYRPDMGGMVDQDERLLYRGGAKDAILQAIGIPLDKGRRERQMLERLHAMRNVDREFGRRMRRAAVRFDYDEMNALRAQYAEKFPDRPPLQLSQNDMIRYEASRRLTRVERMIQSMPGRLGELEQDIYEFDPDLIAAPMQPNMLLAG